LKLDPKKHQSAHPAAHSLSLSSTQIQTKLPTNKFNKIITTELAVFLSHHPMEHLIDLGPEAPKLRKSQKHGITSGSWTTWAGPRCAMPMISSTDVVWARTPFLRETINSVSEMRRRLHLLPNSHSNLEAKTDSYIENATMCLCRNYHEDILVLVIYAPTRGIHQWTPRYYPARSLGYVNMAETSSVAGLANGQAEKSRLKSPTAISLSTTVASTLLDTSSPHEML
jgi:hypothetical protein